MIKANDLAQIPLFTKEIKFYSKFIEYKYYYHHLL